MVTLLSILTITKLIPGNIVPVGQADHGRIAFCIHDLCSLHFFAFHCLVISYLQCQNVFIVKIKVLILYDLNIVWVFNLNLFIYYMYINVLINCCIIYK